MITSMESLTTMTSIIQILWVTSNYLEAELKFVVHKNGVIYVQMNGMTQMHQLHAHSSSSLPMVSIKHHRLQ